MWRARKPDFNVKREKKIIFMIFFSFNSEGYDWQKVLSFSFIAKEGEKALRLGFDVLPSREAKGEELVSSGNRQRGRHDKWNEQEG